MSDKGFGTHAGDKCPGCGGEEFYLHEDVVNTWRNGDIIHTESNGTHGKATCAKCGNVVG